LQCERNVPVSPRQSPQPLKTVNNRCRAWCWRRLAETLPGDDPRVTACAQAARVPAEASLEYVTGDDYMVEHWLAAYAVLLFS
jgi:hypothetical protein